MQKPQRDSLFHWLFIPLLILYFGAAVWIAIRLPAHATPNELLNFEYIQVMRQIRNLPNRGLVDSEIRYTEWHQPPLYFTFAALVGIGVPVPPTTVNPPPPIVWPKNPSFLATHKGNLNPVVHVSPQNTPLLYTSRIAATFLGVIGLAALYRAGRDVYTPAIGLLMISLLAFQPNFIHLSGSVNNDMPLTAVSAVVLSYTILIIHNEKGPKWFFLLGLLCAAAILTKANGAFVLIYLVAASLIILIRSRNIVQAVKSGLFAMAGLLPLWAAWLMLNTIRMKDTLGLEGSFPIGQLLTLNLADLLPLLPWLGEIWRSFWLDWSAGGIGYGPDWLYLIWALFLLFSLLGWLRRPTVRAPRVLTFAVVLGVLAISVLYFAVKALTVRGAGYLVPEGRWWLPVMPGIAWLSAVGFSRWWAPRRQDQAVLIATLMPILATMLLLILFLPALYPKARPLPDNTAVEQKESLTFNGELALFAADVESMTVGRPVNLNITWQALKDIEKDYVIGVQLLVLDPDGWQKLEEQYTFPGNGLSPTKGWHAGDLYNDTLVLIPEGELHGPTQTEVSVQLRTGGEKIQAMRDGAPLDPPHLLETVVRPRSPLAISSPLSEPINFADLFTLEGLETRREEDILHLSLWWHALQQPTEDYQVFVHVFDEDGQLLAQADGQPNKGLSPTHIWQQGDVIHDVRRLPSVPAHAAMLHIGVYSQLTGERLPASQAEQPLPDHSFIMVLMP
ncbi:MAG: glycosyltransferase family 39 protein [Anaerolineaceae bacterium]|nr:MAG: glycosyltransferase family 39 protein [Anaerolineaceae bacterium]